MQCLSTNICYLHSSSCDDVYLFYNLFALSSFTLSPINYSYPTKEISTTIGQSKIYCDGKKMTIRVPLLVRATGLTSLNSKEDVKSLRIDSIVKFKEMVCDFVVFERREDYTWWDVRKNASSSRSRTSKKKKTSVWSKLRKFILTMILWCISSRIIDMSR